MRFTSLLPFGFVSVPVLLLACGAEPSGAPSSSASTSAALLGAPKDTTNTFSVGVCATPPNADADAGAVGACLKGRCTGTLVAPNLVLTARHCVDEFAFEDGKLFCENDFAGAPKAAADLSVTLDASVLGANVSWIKVTDLILPTGANACADDLALLVLADVVPDSAAKPASVDLDRNLATDKPAKIAMVARGNVAERFDVDAGDFVSESGDLTRRINADIDVKCVSDTDFVCKVEDIFSPDNLFELPKELVLIPGVTGAGDSGGAYFEQPSFSQGRPTVVAVNTLGTADPTGAVNSGSGVRVSLHKAFLVDGAKKAQAKGGYPLPAWAGGVAPDAGPEAGLDDGGASGGGGAPDAATGGSSPGDGGGSDDDGGCATSAVGARGAGGLVWLTVGLGLVAATRRARRAPRAR